MLGVVFNIWRSQCNEKGYGYKTTSELMSTKQFFDIFFFAFFVVTADAVSQYSLSEAVALLSSCLPIV